MSILRKRPWYADSNAPRLTSVGLVLIAVVATLDSVIIPDLGFAFLYLIPLCIAAAFMSKWQIVLVAAICATFAAHFSNFSTNPEQLARWFSSFIAYVFVALIIRQIAIVNRAASRHLDDLEQEISL